MIKLNDIPWFICDRDKTNYIVYSDTDSIYVNGDDLVNKRYNDYKSLSEEEKDIKLEIIAKEYENKINDYYNKLSKDLFNIDTHRLEMKTECVIKKGYFSNMRRYVQWIRREEGIIKDKIDIKGLEYVKSNFPPLFKEFFNNIIESVMRDNSKDKVDNIVNQFISELLSGKYNYKEIGNPTSVKVLDKYFTNEYTKGDIFSTIKSGTPISVKSSISYNDLLKFYKLDFQHTRIANGDKVKWVYLKKNKYNIETISFIDYDTPKKINDFINQYIDYNKMFESIILNKLQGLYDDLEWELSI